MNRGRKIEKWDGVEDFPGAVFRIKPHEAMGFASCKEKIEEISRGLEELIHYISWSSHDKVEELREPLGEIQYRLNHLMYIDSIVVQRLIERLGITMEELIGHTANLCNFIQFGLDYINKE